MSVEQAAKLLELREVRKEFPATEGDSDGSGDLIVLRSVSFSLDAGEAIAIVGSSGSGKSTLLNIIGTLDQPSSGEVLLDGKSLARLREPELARLRGETLGFVFQLHHLLPQCTVLENVLVPTLAAAKAQRREQPPVRARRLLERVGLSHRLGHRPGELSGGERQRVAVVRALINEPRLVLADEPTGALDRRSGESLGQLLQELNREEGVSLIVVTHSAALAERMGRVLELRDGTLASGGATQ